MAIKTYSIAPSSIEKFEVIIRQMDYSDWQTITSYPCMRGSKITVLDYQTAGNHVVFIKNSDTDHNISTGWVLQTSGGGGGGGIPEPTTDGNNVRTKSGSTFSWSQTELVTTIEKNTWNGKQNTFVAGTNINIDNTNPLAPVISASGGSSTLDTSYEVLTFAPTVNIDVSKTINNKYIEASGNFAIVMTNKPSTADGFIGDLHIRKTTASDIIVTLDATVFNDNFSGGTPITTITISGGANIEEHLRFIYNKTTNVYYWEVLRNRNNHVRDITIAGGGYTLSIADFDFTKNDQMFFVTTSGGNQDFIIPAGLSLPTGTNIIVCQVSTLQLNIRKGNTTTVIFNAAGGVNTVGVQSNIYLAGQNSMANITSKGGDVYYINGDILQ